MERAKKHPVGVKTAIYDVIIAIIIVTAIVRAIRDRLPEYKTIIIAGSSLVVEVARTPEERAQGLSGRDKLPRDGMIFIFDRPARIGFWMKDMNFPIDIIWMRDRRIVDIAPSIQAPTAKTKTLETYHPRAEADAVLEISAGWSERHDLQIGSSVRYTVP